MISRFALAASLAFTVAACGSQSERTDQPSATDAVPTEAASAPAAPAETVVPTEAASATPTPTASPAPSAAATPKAAASGAGTAGPPQAFNQCTACHSTAPGKTIIGPSLAHVYGRKAGTVAGFQYSDAMKNAGLTWNAANLDAFLANPAGKVPGTMMALPGIKDAAQRKAIVDYLKTL